MNETSSALAASAFPSLGGMTVRAALDSTTQASILLQIYTQAITVTPPIILPVEVDTLTGTKVSTEIQQHQVTAKTNATHFLTVLNPHLATTSASVIGFGNSWNSEFSKLMGSAAKISDQAARADFVKGLDLLLNKIKQEQDLLQPLLDELGKFQALVLNDHDNLSADAALVAKAYDGVGGEIAMLKARIELDNTQRGLYIGMIVGGVLGVVGGVVLIAVGIIATLSTLGLSVGLVLGGLAVVGGSVGALSTASGQLAALDIQISEDRKALAKDQAVYATIAQGAHNVAALVSAVEAGLTALNSLQGSWQRLATDFDQVKQDLAVANPDAGTWLTTVLSKANDEWNDALGIAVSLQRFGSIPVKVQAVGEAA